MSKQSWTGEDSSDPVQGPQPAKGQDCPAQIGMAAWGDLLLEEVEDKDTDRDHVCEHEGPEAGVRIGEQLVAAADDVKDDVAQERDEVEVSVPR